MVKPLPDPGKQRSLFPVFPANLIRLRKIPGKHLLHFRISPPKRISQKAEIRVNSGPQGSVREGITVPYFTFRLFFTDLTPLTLLAISPALTMAF